MKTLPSNISTRRREQAFTMVEIALALAVIAFALVAIIGILPTGLNIAQLSREESIVNRDGTYLLEALRNGAQGMVDLSDYYLNRDGTPSSLSSEGIISQISAPGKNIAVFRAINGSAANRSAVDADLAFRYEVTVEVQPVTTNSISPDVLATQSQMANNLYDVRMVIRWPLVPAPTGSVLGPSSRASRRVFRTLISGTQSNINNRTFFDQNQFEAK